MENDGILIPNEAIMINEKGEFLADRNINPNAEDMGNILDGTTDRELDQVSSSILNQESG